jgi:hypothetical protein
MSERSSNALVSVVMPVYNAAEYILIRLIPFYRNR